MAIRSEFCVLVWSAWPIREHAPKIESDKTKPGHKIHRPFITNIILYSRYNSFSLKNKETLSPSKISTYLACPTKYKWTYIDKRGRWYLRSKSYYSFGTSLHSVLQRFHDDGDKGVTTTSEAIAALEESWIQAGYASQDEMMQALSEGKRIVENYIDNYVSAPVTSKTMFVEKLLKFDVGEFVLIGRIDRLDEREDGSLDIVDYKSGRSSVSSEDIATDLAMGCYQLLFRHHYPGK